MRLHRAACSSDVGGRSGTGMVRTDGGFGESENGRRAARMEARSGVEMMLAAQTRRWRLGSGRLSPGGNDVSVRSSWSRLGGFFSCASSSLIIPLVGDNALFSESGRKSGFAKRRRCWRLTAS